MFSGSKAIENIMISRSIKRELRNKPTALKRTPYKTTLVLSPSRLRHKDPQYSETAFYFFDITAKIRKLMAKLT